MSTILECKNLSKKYGRKQALDNITLSLESGRIIGLLGPNGSGKTTLIKLINGLLAPTGGKLFINGNTPGVESKKIVSYLPERTYLDETQKVSEAITLFEDFYEDFDRSRAISMLEKLNIDSNARIKTLSKGTKEKVQLILVMSRRAKLYCLDEPIAGVDPAARDYILSTIINNYEPDSTILISTHLISDVENILDEVVFIKNGHIVLKNNVEEIILSDILKGLTGSTERIRLHLEATEQQAVVKANPYLLKIALKNIIDNACKYSDKEVNVALYREQQQVILEVEDQGIGIPQEEIEHIFQSFYRCSNTRDYAGQGIGLSLTLKIISAYHGKLDISSEIEKGTKVRVIF